MIGSVLQPGVTSSATYIHTYIHTRTHTRSSVTRTRTCMTEHTTNKQSRQIRQLLGHANNKMHDDNDDDDNYDDDDNDDNGGDDADADDDDGLDRQEQKHVFLFLADRKQ